MRQHCDVFEEKEENKMEYMAIFNHYQQVVEKYILHVSVHLSQGLTQKVPEFEMALFSTLLATRTDQIDEDLLEIVHSFSDFLVFKQLML